ncbi:hypothetical protein K6V78_02230 [Streptococcus gallolyticus]|nr:hypothetical protein [Streptococcus gallolyticus]MBY5040457.1 hypothetical protein [Streptococcus gallolyticus]
MAKKEAKEIKATAAIAFVDIDTDIEYKAGDDVDLSGKSKERIGAMASKENRAGQVLITILSEEKESE